MAKSVIPAANFVAYENKTMVLSLREMSALGLLANLTAPPKVTHLSIAMIFGRQCI